MYKQFFAGDYDAMFYGAPVLSLDPANNRDLWLSSGAFHFWNPGQTTPATAWEAQIDTLMREQATTMDLARRVTLFAQVQKIFAEHEWNVQELENIVFKDRKACVANLSVDGDHSHKEKVAHHLAENKDILSVSFM